MEKIKEMKEMKELTLEIEELEKRIAPGQPGTEFMVIPPGIITVAPESAAGGFRPPVVFGPSDGASPPEIEIVTPNGEIIEPGPPDGSGQPPGTGLP